MTVCVGVFLLSGGVLILLIGYTRSIDLESLSRKFVMNNSRLINNHKQIVSTRPVSCQTTRFMMESGWNVLNYAPDYYNYFTRRSF